MNCPPVWFSTPSLSPTPENKKIINTLKPDAPLKLVTLR